MVRGDADPRRVEGARAAQFPQLRRRRLGTERGRRPHPEGRTDMAELSEGPNEVRIFDGASELMRATAEEIARDARQAVGRHGRFTWALAGGSTPRAVYEL